MAFAGADRHSAREYPATREWSNLMNEDLQARFEQAQLDVKALPKRPTDDELLKLYALFKQATAGDASGPRPGMLDFVGRSKFDAWKKVAGLDPADAMSSYVNTAEKIIAKYR
jgi:diazepam-binding inhibitor (GABA receptor modulating acyl-CoA-binding protein)